MPAIICLGTAEFLRPCELLPDLCGLATAAIARGHGPLLQEFDPAWRSHL